MLTSNYPKQTGFHLPGTLQIPAPHTAHSQTDTSSLMVNQWNCSHHTVSVPTVEARRVDVVTSRDVARVRLAC